MCNIITGVLEANSDTPAFRALVARYHLLFEPIVNPHIVRQLKPSERYYHVTSDHCDCGTSLAARPKAESLERDLRKLRTKGWSEAKIARWAQQRRPRGPQRNGYERLTREEWFAFLDGALQLHKTRSIGLLMHWYRKSTTDENFTIRGRIRTSISELRDGTVRWRENVLYEIGAEGPANY